VYEGVGLGGLARLAVGINPNIFSVIFFGHFGSWIQSKISFQDSFFYGHSGGSVPP
jgi:hypothetical protein